MLDEMTYLVKCFKICTYFWNMKTYVGLFSFRATLNFSLVYVSTINIGQGIHYGWQILKHFTGTFHQA